MDREWQGFYKDRTPEGLEFKCHHNSSLLSLAIPCTNNIRFSAKPENKIDRIAKKLGISVELQTGDAEFDKNIYLTPDNEQQFKALGLDKNLMDALIALKNKSFAANFFESKGSVGRYYKEIIHLKKIICTGEHLIVTYNIPNEIGNNKDWQYSAATHLNLIAERLALHKTKYNVNDFQWWNDPLNYKSAILLSISSALGVAGYIQFLRLRSSSTTTVLDISNLFFPSVTTSLACLILLLTLVWLMTGKNSRTHIIMLDMLIVGGLGMAAYIFSIIYDLNIMLDSSVGYKYKIQVIEKQKIFHKKFPTEYKIIYAVNKNHPLHRNSINVNSFLYKSINHGDFIEITVKDGFLNAPWLYKIEKN